MVRFEAPLVYVVILHWCKYLETQRCIESVRASQCHNCRIVVVDNHSADGSAERLESEYPGIQVLYNLENMGFARGCNVGMRFAFRHGADYVLLLNNDIEVIPGFLDVAIQRAELDPKIGLVTGKILYKNPANVIWHAGGYIDLIRGQGITRGFKEVDQGQYDCAGETKWATGAMMLIRRAVLEKIGFLPEEYFFGVEEWDYSTAVRRSGFKIWYEPKFQSYHEAGASYKAGHPVLIVYNGSRNKQIYQEKYLPIPLFQLWRFVYWIYVYVWWPRRAGWGCKDEIDYAARVIAAKLAVRDHKSGKRVELEDLVHVSAEIGPTTTWPSTWYSTQQNTARD